MKISTFLMGVCFMGLASSVNISTSHAVDAAKSASVLANTVKSMEGTPVELSKYEGKVLLVVNVASKCGYTSQYSGMQEVYAKYKEKGFEVLGFPCNQFGGQEPGSNKEIQEFCSSKYKVTFDMFDKIDVNGANANPFYKQLTAAETKPKGAGKVAWNFEKFLINKKGEVVARFPSSAAPEGKEVTAAIEKALAE
jgi:glutathione peroxidase